MHKQLQADPGNSKYCCSKTPNPIFFAFHQSDSLEKATMAKHFTILCLLTMHHTTQFYYMHEKIVQEYKTNYSQVHDSI
jgi:hypothetical protein